MNKFGLLALGLVASAQATDYLYVDDPVSGYNAQGVPLNMTNINDSLPADILNNIYGMLPESVVVDPAFIATDTRSNILIGDDVTTFATASVTFLNEGAGYRNSLGYFVYDTNNPPATKDDIAEHIIILPNASKPGDGNMQQGDMIELGIQMFAGQSLGFFVVPNGWSYNGSGSAIFWDGPWNQPFYSLEHLNPETVAGQKRHNVVFVDPVSELFIIGFDDQLISYGDKDYNDLLFSVDVTPFVAVDGVNEDNSLDGGYIPLQQSEGSNEVTTSWYPSQNGYATMMFEDQWPVKGDYDFNDLVVKYRLKRTLAAQSALQRLEADYIVQARGASFLNGFALHLPGVDKNNIASLSLLKNGVAVSHTIVEAAASETVLIISPNITDDVGSSCEMFRSLPSCRENINLEFTLDISFTDPVLPAVVGQAPYDPFIYGLTYHGDIFSQPPERSWELHFKEFAGTSLFNSSFFNMAEDASNATYNFINANGLPWAVNITDTVDHSAEYIDIKDAYPNFQPWVLSSGFDFTDWYLRSNAVTSNLYE